jgi:hypothetical protein
MHIGARITRHIVGTIVVCAVSGAAAGAAGAATLPSPPPTLNGEQLYVNSEAGADIGAFTSGRGYCQSPDSELSSFKTHGATGPVSGEMPYPGEFTEFFDAAFGPTMPIPAGEPGVRRWACPLRAATLGFAIDSAVGHVTGTATLESDGQFSMNSTDYGDDTRIDMHVGLRYSAQIVPRLGLSYRDHGTVAVDLATDGRPSGEYSLRAVFTSDIAAAEQVGSDETPPSLRLSFPFASPLPSDPTGPVRTRVRWSPYDPVGICESQLDVSVDGGPFEPVALATPTARSLIREHRLDQTYQYRARAIDCVGNTSEYQISKPFTVHIDDDTADDVFSFADTWSHGGRFSAFDHTISTSSEGAVTYAGTMRRVAWISSLGPTSASASVSVDGGEPTSVFLYAASPAQRRVVWQKSWTTPAPHVIRITPTSGTVEVDAIATLR